MSKKVKIHERNYKNTLSQKVLPSIAIMEDEDSDEEEI